LTQKLTISDDESYAIEFLKVGGVELSGRLGAVDVNPAGPISIFLSEDGLNPFVIYTFEPASEQPFLRLFRLNKGESPK
jgi:hypothetical protein